MTAPRKFGSGARVVTNTALACCPAGTALVVVRALKDAADGGLYSGEPYQVRREDGAAMPWDGGPASEVVLKAEWLDAAPLVYRTEKHLAGWRVYGAEASPEGSPVGWFETEADADLFRDLKNATTPTAGAGLIARALAGAERFVSGFEDDDTQEGIGALLSDLRAAAAIFPEPDPHNPDTNPAWTPLLAYRVYACEGCGAESTFQTNHTGRVPLSRCAGRCRTITHAHTEREQVAPLHGPHRFVREA